MTRSAHPTGARDEIRTAFESYIDSYFRRRDVDGTLGMLHPDLTGFGIGADERLVNGGGAEELYRRDLIQAPEPISVDLGTVDVLPLGDQAGIVTADMDIHGVIDEQPFIMNGLRRTLVMTNAGGPWQVINMHVSLPTGIHAEGEAYPLSEIEERNRPLEAMVAQKTRELLEQNEALEQVIAQNKTLRGLVPSCSHCKNIRNVAGFWSRVEEWMSARCDVRVSHGICPDCVEKHLPE